MRVKLFEVDKKDSVQIYVKKDEEDLPEVKAKIEELKNKDKNVTIFVSGTEDIKENLQKLVNYMSLLEKT